MNKTTVAQSAKTTSFLPPAQGILQRKCDCGNHTVAGGKCAECNKKNQALQRKAVNRSDASDVPPIVHEVLRSPSQTLDPATRAFMEPRFGHDFSQVRIHTDSKAAESARTVNALAYTVGRDIVFQPEYYQPSSTEGKRLLAHELTHVLQQSQGTQNIQRAELRANSPIEVSNVGHQMLSRLDPPYPGAIGRCRAMGVPCPAPHFHHGTVCRLVSCSRAATANLPFAISPGVCIYQCLDGQVCTCVLLGSSTSAVCVITLCDSAAQASTDSDYEELSSRAVALAQQQLGNESAEQGGGRLESGVLMQTKLEIGESGNVYEREADAVAEKVMRIADLDQGNVGSRATANKGSLLQRFAFDTDGVADSILNGVPSRLIPSGVSKLQRQQAGPNPANKDVEREKIIDVSKRTQGNMGLRAVEIVWRMLTRYFPEYSPNVAGVGYDEKEPGVRVNIKEVEQKGKKVQSAILTVGKRFAEATSEETLRERIEELGLSLAGLRAIPDPQGSTGSATVWKIINDKFPKKGRRLGGTSYDANLPGLVTEFKTGSVKVGMVTKSWSAPRLYFGKTFLALPDGDKESPIGEELKKIDKWSVENFRIFKDDLEDEDITLRIRGLSSSSLTNFRDKVADPTVKAYAASLLKISTPLEQGLAAQADGSAKVEVGNLTVLVTPDDTNVAGLSGGDTNFDISTPGLSISPDPTGQIVRSVTPPPHLIITIHTRFGTGPSADTTSGYGRGATGSDKEVGAKTLRVHEGSHGLEYLRLIITANQRRPYPLFTVKKGDSWVSARKKLADFQTEQQAFVDEVRRNKLAATQAVDCVGITIDEYNQKHNINKGKLCP